MRVLLLLLLLPAVTLSSDHSFGWRSAPAGKHIKKQFVHNPAFDTPIKPVTDLTAGMPSVYDQGVLGSCTANAILAAFEFAWHQKHGAFMGGSRLGLYQAELKHDGSFPQDAGSYTTSGVWVLTNQGVGLEKCWPYVIGNLAKNWPSCYPKSAATHKLVTAYDVDNTDHVSIRKALSAGFPVAFGGYVYSGIENLPPSNILPMPKKGERPIGGHELLLVGHNDAKKLYKARNSWNVTYGEAGYLYIPFAYVENPKICEDFAVLEVTQ